jgi:ubiquinone/menaquinone biosynthesis C-methylase UbiE
MGLRNFAAYYSDLISLEGRDVLDVGCGLGTKALLYATSMKPRSMVAVDIEEASIARARKHLDKCQPSGHVKAEIAFSLCSEKTLPFAGGSFDIVLMNSMFEHVFFPSEVVSEAARVLRPGGYLCIDFVPWLHPKGHHLGRALPIPWAHVLFSERTLLAVAARAYDEARYEPYFWELQSPELRKPNPWRGLRELPHVSKMTILKFENVVAVSGLHVVRYWLCGFESSDRLLVRSLSRPVTPLLRSGVLREYFTRAVVCVLRKGVGEAAPTAGALAVPQVIRDQGE